MNSKHPVHTDPLLNWVVWTLVFALVLGGKPWRFPANGKYWLENVRKGRAFTQ